MAKDGDKPYLEISLFHSVFSSIIGFPQKAINLVNTVWFIE